MNINERLSVSIGELARFVRNKGQKEGDIKWSSGASVGFTFDTYKSLLVLKYTYQQTESVEEPIKIVRTATNLHNGLQCFALCPVTGKLCRKLYLYGSLFVSRYAIPEHYASCNRSRKQRDFESAFSIIKYGENIKYRKGYYKGRLTPYGKKYFKAYEKFDAYNFQNLL